MYMHMQQTCMHDIKFNECFHLLYFSTVLKQSNLTGCTDVVNLLIKQGARVNYDPDYNKPSPLDLAILKGDVDMVKMLIAAGKYIMMYYRKLIRVLFLKNH